MAVKKGLISVIFILTVILVSSTAGAHHLWVEKNSDSYTVARGVLGERFDAYEPGRVSDFTALMPDGSSLKKENIQRADKSDKAVFNVSGKISIAAVTCDWGYRVNTTRGKKFMRRTEAEKEGLKVISAFFSTQYSKVFFEQGSGNTKPLGLKLEIVPLDDPSLLHKGDKLSVQALFDGKPLANALITGAEKEEIKTDSNGIGNFIITGKGKTLLMLGHKVPVKNDPEKDFHRYTSFMVFEVK